MQGIAQAATVVVQVTESIAQITVTVTKVFARELMDPSELMNEDLDIELVNIPFWV